MDVKPGYKQTAVGLIPEDWDCRPLENLIAPGTSITYGIVQAGPHVEGGIPYIKTGDMSGDRLPTDGLARTSPKIASRYPRSTVRAGELVYSIRASVGSIHRVPFELDGANLTQGTARIAPNKSIDAEFLLRALRSYSCQNWVNFRTKGTTYKEITLATLRQVPVPLPSLSEQRAIAATLSDVDALIAALDRLIAKKRDIKQAAMQELLTGKRRLPGFKCGKGYKHTEVGVIPADWDVRTLQDICRVIVDGTHFTPKYVNDGIPFYSVENVTANNFSDTKFISQKEHAELTKRCKPEKDDILLTRIGSLGDTKLIDWNVDASIYVSLALLKLGKIANPNYVYQYTKFRQFVQDIEKRSLMNATPKKINMGNIGIVPIPLPPTLKEQCAISEVLSDMDAEIAALEARRDKTRSLKQGMMQELLTGRIRLV